MNPDRWTLTIEGMTCGGCAASVDAALRQIDGVEHVEVDLAGGRAVVEGHHVVADDLLAALREVGFDGALAA